MQRRFFLKQSAIVSLGTALTQSTGILPTQPVFAASADSKSELNTIRDLKRLEQLGANLKGAVLKGLDLGHLDIGFWKSTQIEDTYFLGCKFSDKEVEDYLQGQDTFFLHRIKGLPYDPFRPVLYSPDELMSKTTSGMIKDEEIYENYVAKGKASTDMLEAFARRVHDFSMDDGLEQLTDEISVTDMVCVTGGFFQERTDPWFRKTAQMARLLSLDNKFVVTGGGPGIMEAANLGAYLSAYGESALDTALEVLAKAPKWTDEDWLNRSSEVLERFPNGKRSLGIPTWFYGFEPTNLFATDIAKYFDNDIREGILMSIAKGGAVFAPGSAGARQEIFMVATQNHFGSNGYFYPMVLFGKDHYQVDTHVFQLLQQVANENYEDLIYSTDESAEVVTFILDHPPRRSTSPH